MALWNLTTTMVDEKQQDIKVMLVIVFAVQLRL